MRIAIIPVKTRGTLAALPIKGTLGLALLAFSACRNDEVVSTYVPQPPSADVEIVVEEFEFAPGTTVGASPIQIPRGRLIGLHGRVSGVEALQRKIEFAEVELRSSAKSRVHLGASPLDTHFVSDGTLTYAALIEPFDRPGPIELRFFFNRSEAVVVLGIVTQ